MEVDQFLSEKDFGALHPSFSHSITCRYGEILSKSFLASSPAHINSLTARSRSPVVLFHSMILHVPPHVRSAALSLHAGNPDSFTVRTMRWFRARRCFDA